MVNCLGKSQMAGESSGKIDVAWDYRPERLWVSKANGAKRTECYNVGR